MSVRERSRPVAAVVCAAERPCRHGGYPGGNEDTQRRAQRQAKTPFPGHPCRASSIFVRQRYEFSLKGPETSHLTAPAKPSRPPQRHVFLKSCRENKICSRPAATTGRPAATTGRAARKRPRQRGRKRAARIRRAHFPAESNRFPKLFSYLCFTKMARLGIAKPENFVFACLFARLCVSLFHEDGAARHGKPENIVFACLYARLCLPLSHKVRPAAHTAGGTPSQPAAHSIRILRQYAYEDP